MGTGHDFAPASCLLLVTALAVRQSLSCSVLLTIMSLRTRTGLGRVAFTAGWENIWLSQRVSRHFVRLFMLSQITRRKVQVIVTRLDPRCSGEFPSSNPNGQCGDVQGEKPNKDSQPLQSQTNPLPPKTSRNAGADAAQCANDQKKGTWAPRRVHEPWPSKLSCPTRA